MMRPKIMESGWLKGRLIRTARKSHRCDYWMGLSSGGRCRHIIQPGEQYVEGDTNDEAGGFGCDRMCMDHARIGCDDEPPLSCDDERAQFLHDLYRDEVR